MADLVTSRRANLHNLLVRLCGLGEPYLFPDPTPTYGVAYRPVGRAGVPGIDGWPTALTAGAPLPTVLLALKGYQAVPLNLDASYEKACRMNGIR